MMRRNTILVGLAVLSACTPSPKSENEQTRCPSAADLVGAFVNLPAGDFEKGAGAIYAEEMPQMMLHVDGFSMQAHEVTNSQFRKFVEATGYITDAERSSAKGGAEAGSAVFYLPAQGLKLAGSWELVRGATWKSPEGPGSDIAGLDDYPVVQVSLNDAKAYAAWAGGRLPDEVEWEYAASLGLESSERTTSGAYDASRRPIANTWQGVFPVVDTGEDGFRGASPVGCFAGSRIGLYDMIGNVWEWTDTPYNTGTHTLKGGSYLCADNFCRRYRPEARQPQEDDFSSNHIGFRIVENMLPDQD